MGIWPKILQSRCCVPKTGTRASGERANRYCSDVCFWPKANMEKNAINVAIGGKADMALCGNSLSRSLLGVKRTWLVAAHMSAFDAVDGAHSAASRVP